MFPTDNSLSKIADIITKGGSGVVILPSNPSVDAVASATGLYLGLVKLGKNITLVSSAPVKSDLIGVDKILDTMATSGENLVISFPYTDGAIDKVDYNIQGNNFNLIVSPRAGQPKLDPNQVKYTYTGGMIDFIITVDSPNLNSLGDIYTDNQNQFQGKNIINIDRHLTNGFFGTANFVNKTSSSTSELILKILQALNAEIDKDMATNLYAGIISATNNFGSYSVNADTLETAAGLLKLGAVKRMPPRPSVQPARSMGFEKNVNPIETVEKAPQIKEGPAPQDWLKPKIFRGGGGLV